MSGNSDTSRDGDEGGYLAKMLRGAQIEWPPNENSYFIPINKIRALENQELVWEELQGLFPTMSGDRLENYVKVICTKATKIFAVILFSPPRKSEAILTFIDEGITDANLPLVRVYRRRGSPTYTLAKKEHDECHEQGHRGCGIKALSKWGRTGIQNLCRDQWLAQAPVFKKCEQEILHYEFDGAVILPFTDDEENAEGGLKIGGYSEVWGVKIHPAHQDILISADTSKPPRIAVKRLYSRQREDFDKERQMLISLTLKDHPHLVKLLTTYKYKGKFHLLCPYADANLRTFWGSKVPKTPRHTYLWALKQMTGLASALNVIHNFETTHPLGSDKTNPSVSRDRPSIPQQLTVSPGEERFGRHGDLKPENILWTAALEAADSGGTLQIADLGLGRFHRMESRSKQDPKNINGSPTYMPPELALDKLVSRAYDIWSLGCIYLEFITWILRGPKGLTEFGKSREARAYDGIVDDTFYTLFSPDSGRYCELREGVANWMQKLRQNNNCSELILEILNLVENGMLRVDAGDRISAEDLEVFLKRRLEKGELDLVYLVGDA